MFIANMHEFRAIDSLYMVLKKEKRKRERGKKRANTHTHKYRIAYSIKKIKGNEMWTPQHHSLHIFELVLIPSIMVPFRFFYSSSIHHFMLGEE